MTEQEKILSMIDEYLSSGGSDLMEFRSQVSSAAAATPFLGLNHWKSSDKPVMDDFNRDNEKIDAAVRELWAKKVNTAPPTVYDLPLGEGFELYGSDSSHENIYYKTENGIVSVHFAIRSTLGNLPARETVGGIAYLPAGFRPLKTRHTACYGTPYCGCSVYVTAGGSINIQPFESCSNVFGEILFLAAQ